MLDKDLTTLVQLRELVERTRSLPESTTLAEVSTTSWEALGTYDPEINGGTDRERDLARVVFDCLAPLHGKRRGPRLLDNPGQAAALALEIAKCLQSESERLSALAQVRYR